MTGRSRALRLALGAALAAMLLSRVASVFTVAVNWDEFALMARADQTAHTGVLHGGGRPGLATLLLLPFVEDCGDEIAVARRARLLWLALTLAFLAGVGALAAQLQPDPRRRVGDAALAVGLLALVPAFLEWSLQVRSDQIALAGGVWGGTLLLASRRRPALALAAGALFGVGYLGSQKLLYAAVLSALLALGQLRLARELRPARDALRALACAAGFATALLAFQGALGLLAEAEVLSASPSHRASAQVVTREALSSGLAVFDYYRRTLGTSQYRELLPALGPHGLLLAALAFASAAALRGRGAPHSGDALLLAWGVLLLGASVAAFHAAAFSYFWMTLGLFPALAFAVARRPLLALLAPLRPRLRGFALGAWWTLLLAPGLAQAALLLRDTQAVQRESLAFVHRNFDRSDAGFHPESALFCQAGTQPIDTHFSQTIYRDYGVSREAAERNERAMVRRHRELPVRFLLQSFRLNQFPVSLRRFWAEHYQPYRGSVFVAGRRLEGAPGDEREFELIVPGDYRWLPFANGAGGSVWIDGRRLDPGAVVALDRGHYRARLADDAQGGLLVLALNDAPGPAPRAFYKRY